MLRSARHDLVPVTSRSRSNMVEVIRQPSRLRSQCRREGDGDGDGETECRVDHVEIAMPIQIDQAALSGVKLS
jgi:hypothetical protein